MIQLRHTCASSNKIQLAQQSRLPSQICSEYPFACCDQLNHCNISPLNQACFELLPRCRDSIDWQAVRCPLISWEMHVKDTIRICLVNVDDNKMMPAVPDCWRDPNS